MRLKTISFLIMLCFLYDPIAHGERVAQDGSKIDPFSTRLTENRARCGFTFHNGTLEYVVTDKDVPSGIVTSVDALKPIEVGPYSPAVRNVNVAVNIKKPLLLSAATQTGSKIEVFQVRRESPASKGPSTNQQTRYVGGVSLQTSGVVPVVVRSDIKLEDVRTVHEMTPADRWNGSVLKPRSIK